MCQTLQAQQFQDLIWFFYTEVWWVGRVTLCLLDINLASNHPFQGVTFWTKSRRWPQTYSLIKRLEEKLQLIKMNIVKSSLSLEIDCPSWCWDFDWNLSISQGHKHSQMHSHSTQRHLKYSSQCYYRKGKNKISTYIEKPIALQISQRYLRTNALTKAYSNLGEEPNGQCWWANKGAYFVTFASCICRCVEISGLKP